MSKQTIRAVGLVLALSYGAASPVSAQPDPAMSTVPDHFVWSPGGAVNEVIVRDSGGTPIGNAVVQLQPSLSALISGCQCSSPTTVYADTTGNDGKAVFLLYGGGCVLASTLGGNVATVTVTNLAVPVVLDTVDFVSPDILDLDGNPTPAGGPCVVDLTDIVWFRTNTSLLGGSAPYDPCADFDGNGVVDLTDAVRFTALVSTIPGCP